MMKKLFLSICFYLIFSCAVSASGPTDSTMLGPFPVTPAHFCSSAASETATRGSWFLAIYFNTIRDTNNGGVLCPGKYAITAVCVVNTLNAHCGGSSCGWNDNPPGTHSTFLYDSANNVIARSNWHSGPSVSHGNIPENQNAVTVFLTSGTIDTSINKQLYMLSNVEGQAPDEWTPNSCTVYATKTSN